MPTRRHFLQTGPALLAAAGLAGADQNVSPNNRIRIATIGFGGMGMGDTRYALTVPGVELAAVCDVYDGRLTRAREVHGDAVFTTRDYREVLGRKDIDAVIIATPDHWHSALSVAAMDAGKDVYCEKPMVQSVADGKEVIAAQQRTGRIFQVGSQYVTSLVYQKARDLVQSGAIGRLTMVEAWLDRNTALGAWLYSIPPDASPATIDWDRFLGRAPKRPFEAIRLFRWRNYRDYGTGVAGDLFVHLLSGLHLVTGSAGPERILATGGLRYWNDGRDVPDVMLAMLDYAEQPSHPAFTLSLRVNLKSGVPEERFGFRFMGTGGVITTSMSSLLLEKAPPEREPGYTIDTFSKAVQEEFLRHYRQKYPPQAKLADKIEPEKFAPPQGYDAHREHHRVFYEAVRNRQRPVEDAVFGFRAAGAALLANTSYFEKRVCYWDAPSMTVPA
ncbi:MAG TPA: Gfo/Idh/MocA family oxidoreductase [Bryobacteraceae bacterium]|nr:Gfo/Idh/MocA family oxidoreductase [Bryobacteraceae bacterium]